MKEKVLKQHEVKTDYIIHGERTYYVDGLDLKDAEKRFNKEQIHDTLAKDSIFMMEEHVKDVNTVDRETDVKALQAAQRLVEAEAWDARMQEIIAKSRNKLRKEMDYGVKD